MYNINMFSDEQGTVKVGCETSTRNLMKKADVEKLKLEVEFYRILASNQLKAKVARLIEHHQQTKPPLKTKSK